MLERTLGMLAIAGVLATGAPCLAQGGETTLSVQELPILKKDVRIRRDSHDIPHIFGLNDHDVVFALGYYHAANRFFQMDTLRRTFSGTLAELVGPAALASDVQFRTLGLRRAAEETFPALSPGARVVLQAYANGVNAWLGDASHALPPEYGALELTRAGIPLWSAVDSVTIAKGLAFSLSFDIGDIDRTLILQAYVAAGIFLQFDGTALFSHDLFRSAPFDPTVSIPQGMPAPTTAAGVDSPLTTWPSYLDGRALDMAARVMDEMAKVPALRSAVTGEKGSVGSNWWLASGAVTESGHPMLANDPHLGLDSPPIFMEAQLRVAGGIRPPMNVNGVTFPGTPLIAQGCNPSLCWGSTVNPMDVTDVYLEELVIDPQTHLPVATLFDGVPEPLLPIFQTYLVNQIGDQIPDDLIDAGIGPLEGGVTLIVPRRNMGPIISIDASDPADVVALSVQYTGWRATHEAEAFLRFARARTVQDFAQALQLFDFGSQNTAVATTDGHIAYFTSAELPIREDLQDGVVDGGVPPFLIRDGTHTLHHEWAPVSHPQPRQALAYEILPFAEMPQVVDPTQGYVLSANNDPIGTTLDNNPLNQLRPGGGLYYLSPGYATGFRAGRISRLLEAALADHGKLSKADFEAIQHNNQLLDAEVLTPYILQAWQSATAPGADPLLSGLAADPGVAEAVDRLSSWDFSTPTGIPQGWDPGDDPTNLPAPGQEEIDSSVAATIYALWRGQILDLTVDRTLAGVGLQGTEPGSSIAMADLRHLLDTFPQTHGVGASGLQFFDVFGAPTPEVGRDVLVLQALRDALDLLASDDFEPAFGNSTDQEDYRWGYLHRIVFDHPLGGPFSLPPAGGLMDVGPGLPGLARSGGFGSVDAASHSARADGLNDFMFGSGPARRYVGVMSPALDVEEVIPGGESGSPVSPFLVDQLPLWLTNHHHPMLLYPGDVAADTVRFDILRARH